MAIEEGTKLKKVLRETYRAVGFTRGDVAEILAADLARAENHRKQAELALRICQVMTEILDEWEDVTQLMVEKGDG